MNRHRERSVIVHNLRLQRHDPDHAPHTHEQELLAGAYFLCKNCGQPHLAPRHFGRTAADFRPAEIPHATLACPRNGMMSVYAGVEFYWDMAPPPMPRWWRR